MRQQRSSNNSRTFLRDNQDNTVCMDDIAGEPQSEFPTEFLYPAQQTNQNPRESETPLHFSLTLPQKPVLWLIGFN